MFLNLVAFGIFFSLTGGNGQIFFPNVKPDQMPMVQETLRTFYEAPGPAETSTHHTIQTPVKDLSKKHLHHEPEAKELKPDDDKASKIIFKLYTRSHMTGELIVMNGTKSNIRSFSPHRNSIILIHGSSERDMQYYVNFFTQVLVNAFLKNCDCNIFGVDWSRLVEYNNTLQNVQNAAYVGEMTGAMIDILKDDFHHHWPLPFMVVAHHTGTVGAIAITKRTRIHRIMGLAPMDLGVDSYPDYKYLRRYHADIVEVIHTFGFQQNLAHRDFYASGGGNQSNCHLEDDHTCSIRRAFEYYAVDTYLHGKAYNATYCSEYEFFKDHWCSRNPSVSLYNEFSASEALVGKYYFDPVMRHGITMSELSASVKAPANEEHQYKKKPMHLIGSIL